MKKDLQNLTSCYNRVMLSEQTLACSKYVLNENWYLSNNNQLVFRDVKEYGWDEWQGQEEQLGSEWKGNLCVAKWYGKSYGITCVHKAVCYISYIISDNLQNSVMNQMFSRLAANVIASFAEMHKNIQYDYIVYPISSNQNTENIVQVLAQHLIPNNTSNRIIALPEDSASIQTIADAMNNTYIQSIDAAKREYEQTNHQAISRIQELHVLIDKLTEELRSYFAKHRLGPSWQTLSPQLKYDYHYDLDMVQVTEDEFYNQVLKHKQGIKQLNMLKDELLDLQQNMPTKDYINHSSKLNLLFVDDVVKSKDICKQMEPIIQLTNDITKTIQFFIPFCPLKSLRVLEAHASATHQ